MELGHQSVLLREVVEGIAPKQGGVYIDATCGLGGHSEAMLDASAPDGRVMSIDRDPDALAIARKRLARFGDRSTVVEGDFSSVGRIAREQAHAPADGVLADLGVSSLQLDDGPRGFSFRADAPLDMRMGPRVGQTAEELLAEVDLGTLCEILRDFGEIPRPKRVARALIDARDAGALKTTSDLVRAVQPHLPHRRGPGGKKTHPATRVFQAIRIAVNRELAELEGLLEAVPSLLKPGGRVAIISFHSLEDRIVKKAFREPPVDPRHRHLPISREPQNPLEAVNRRPILPAAEEIDGNPRARSAKLRIAERRPERSSK